MMINILIAFFLDFFLGDPVFAGHPVRLIGSMLSLYERLLYPIKRRVIGGFLLVVGACLTVFWPIFFLNVLKNFGSLPRSINIISIFLIYFIICNRDMIRETKSVYRSLIRGNIESARINVGRIVGRDTSSLDVKGIIRAAVESVAENTVDGFTAPLFYLVLGGIPLAYLYKTVNTIDSRFGYRNERYEKFGKIGARFDDILNFIPARLNGFFILCAAGFKKDVFIFMKEYGRMHPSPNSGISEAGFSGQLGLALGGPSIYNGEEKNKPWIGKNRLSSSELEEPQIILHAVSFYWRIITINLIANLAALFLLDLPLIFS